MLRAQGNTEDVVRGDVTVAVLVVNWKMLSMSLAAMVLTATAGEASAGVLLLTSSTTAPEKVLTTKEKPMQSTACDSVVVLSKMVLVPSKGNANTGLRVVDVLFIVLFVASVWGAAKSPSRQIAES